MSPKKELAKEMQLLEEEIKILEVKRSRSQAELIESLISHREPDPSEVQFFRTYTADIGVKRDRLAELTEQLKKLV